eukprot:CAMPEP_0201510192 /NCGR_PEP_ID=MMETSP0161_2-20130828/2981_1 /ASSEMBLY_ACC=CAM_ASM_000251 /TAXON_ID=180227 /ORGANISM="Neoparamoeba aestuarina, Strain SoJaBio B1-5/56/2" /LENGTH=832 /DNA_ID=CAMNT_0047905335 /DNA_START=37 /DNA_END=2535 /DNA_ORIENTATION=-
MAASMPSNVTFHRKYEKTFGYIKPEEFPEIDWAIKEQLEMLFPAYIRAQIANGGQTGFGGTIEMTINLRTPFGDRDLLVNSMLEIEPNKRCAVYGINGSGKTCLFNALASGEVARFPEHINVHHMKEPEHNAKADGLSVIDSVLCSHKFRRVLLPCEEKLTQLVAEEKDETRKAALQANLDYVQEKLTQLRSDTAAKRAQSMLRVLGFDEKGEQALVSSLSGGLRMRVALASAFFIEPQLLLLDEPTNHLDMPSVLWLENRLRAYKGSFLLVTHDRTLLENVVTSVMLIQDMKLEYFNCGFSEFEKRKAKNDAEREKMIEQYMKRNRNVDADSPAYPRWKSYREWQRARAERRKLMENKFSFKAPPPLKLPEGVEDQQDVSLVKVENVRFSYDPENLPFIFDNPISYDIKLGTRVGIMGPNGAGKSTFLKLVTEKLTPTEGKITINPDYQLAYFGQHSTKELKMNMSPIEFMCTSFPEANKGNLKTHLERTSIGESTANTAIKNLSYSQRSCVIFAKLTFYPPHLLIMDEPTNFLDLDSVDSLIKAANKFSGGLIVVTHNRDFLRRCSKNFLSIVPGQFQELADMRSAERATYSFISAMEEGRAIDAKSAIVQNRGGGAEHTDEEQAARKKALLIQQRAEKKKRDAAAAEKKAAEEAAAAKEAARLAKLALQRTDWKADEVVWINFGGKWQEATVTRNVPGVGVTVQLSTGACKMVDAKKLRAENPQPPKAAPAPKAGGAGGRGQSSGGRGQSSGGRGQGNKGKQQQPGGYQKGGQQGGYQKGGQQGGYQKGGQQGGAQKGGQQGYKGRNNNNNNNNQRQGTKPPATSSPIR